MTDVRKLKVFRVVPHARLPTKATLQSAGYDLYSAYRYNISPKGKELLDTGLCICLPEGSYGKIEPVSKLAWKYQIDVGGTFVYYKIFFNCIKI